MRDELLDSPLIFGDETELQVLKEPGRRAQAKSYIWAQMTDGSGNDGQGPPIRLFAYAPSRSTKTARELYAGSCRARARLAHKRPPGLSTIPQPPISLRQTDCAPRPGVAYCA